VQVAKHLCVRRDGMEKHEVVSAIKKPRRFAPYSE